MKRKVLLSFLLAGCLGLIFALSGCATIDKSFDKSKVYAAEAADTALKTAEWGTCYVPSVGSLRRRYSSDGNRIVGWQMYCTEVWAYNGEKDLEIFTVPKSIKEALEEERNK